VCIIYTVDEYRISSTRKNMHKRITSPPELPATDLTKPGDHLASQMVKEFRKFSIDSGRLVTGEFAIETENPEGLHVLYQIFPSGDFFLWFIENGFFTLIALVDEKMKTITKLPVSMWSEFQANLEIVIVGMCNKNGYNPEDIQTRGNISNDDNPQE
jgi:hypothetical protein